MHMEVLPQERTDREGTLRISELKAVLNATIAKFNLLYHPFYQAWRRGS
jgi:hypothetical protein